MLLSVVGAGVLVGRRDHRALTFLLFPALFFALMAAQKVNFTRNVLVLLPVLSVLAAVAVQALSARTRAPRVLTALAIALAAMQPAIEAIARRRPAPPESRTLAAQWLDKAAGQRSESVAASNWSGRCRARAAVASPESIPSDSIRWRSTCAATTA